MSSQAPAVKRRIGDLVFSNLALSSGVTILVILAAVAIFLFAESLPMAFLLTWHHFFSEPSSHPLLHC
jgi:ABC-type phosphate transport system permease subunit